MRIKNLKAKNIYSHGSDLNMSINEQESIILIRQPNDENYFIPFTSDFLEIVDCLLFNDSYTYVKNMLSNQSLIECTLERKGVEYTFGIKGNCSKKTKDGYVRMRSVLDWYCIVPEKELQGKNGGWLGAQLSCASQEYFYPEELREFTRFRKDTYADSPTDFIHWERFSELKRTAKYNELDVDLEKKLQEIINECSEIRLDARLSVRLNEDKEYVLYWYGEEVTAQEDLELINFCGWINNLNILKRLYEFVGEEGDFPIFIESDFDSDLGQYKDVLIKKLRETGRQVFIISQKRDEGLEKLCDKVLVLN